jgi:hypothetical protein
MGDEVKFTKGQQLVVRFPLACHARLLRDGKLLTESQGSDLEHQVEGPGVYRVEGWVKLAGEERPWIYSNPIYIR